MRDYKGLFLGAVIVAFAVIVTLSLTLAGTLVAKDRVQASYEASASKVKALRQEVSKQDDAFLVCQDAYDAQYLVSEEWRDLASDVSQATSDWLDQISAGDFTPIDLTDETRRAAANNVEQQGISAGACVLKE